VAKQKMFGLKPFKLGEVNDSYELPPTTKRKTLTKAKKLSMKKLSTKPIKAKIVRKKRRTGWNTN
jgi:hypothetical protein